MFFIFISGPAVLCQAGFNGAYAGAPLDWANSFATLIPSLILLIAKARFVSRLLPDVLSKMSFSKKGVKSFPVMFCVLAALQEALIIDSISWAGISSFSGTGFATRTEADNPADIFSLKRAAAPPEEEIG